MFKNYFKRSPLEYFGKIILYIFITIVVGGITYFLCNLLPFYGWGGLILKGMICCMVPNILLVLIYHKCNEYIYMKQLILKLGAKLKRR